MGVNSLPKPLTRQRRGCDLNLGPSALLDAVHIGATWRIRWIDLCGGGGPAAMYSNLVS